MCVFFLSKLDETLQLFLLEKKKSCVTIRRYVCVCVSNTDGTFKVFFYFQIFETYDPN